MLERVTMPVNLEAFFESIDKCGASDELKAAMKDSFNILHESVLEEGLGDALASGARKFGKLAAVGAIALGATNADAAKVKSSVPTGGKAKTTVTSQTYRNLWQNQKFQDRVEEITNQLVAAKEAANKPYSYDILQSRAWDMALAELNHGKLK